ncbi:MAG: hypothetical protein EBS23_07155, partial [Betaproteobacteria bacterium]|nr:hypothetical protein [Betaproteobacteria bacterium]
MSLNLTGGFTSRNVGNNIPVDLNATLSGNSAINYALNQPSRISASITPRPVSVLGISALSRPYDGTANAVLALQSASIAGQITGDDLIFSASGAFADPNAGTNKPVRLNVNLSGSSLSDYTLAQPSDVSANITPLTAIYTANPATRDEQTANPTFSGTVSGLINQDLGLAASAVFTSPATIAAPAGNYPILGSGINTPNYAFEQAPGNATALTVTARVTEMVQQTQTAVTTQIAAAVRIPVVTPPPVVVAPPPV